MIMKLYSIKIKYLKNCSEIEIYKNKKKYSCYKDKFSILSIIISKEINFNHL